MTLKSLFSFQGRFSRSQFWLWGFGLPALVGALCVGLISALMVPSADADGVIGIFIVLGLLYLPLTYVGIAGAVKRLHDLGRSGWWYLLTLIPLINVGFVIWIGAFKGSNGLNQYGVDPVKTSIKNSRSFPSHWVLIGVTGQYKGCEFPFDEDITFGTDPKLCSIVFDRLKYPNMKGRIHRLSFEYPCGGTSSNRYPELFFAEDTSTILSWSRGSIRDGRVDIGHGQLFQLKPIAWFDGV